jgi:hypothetical protein
MYKGKYNLLPQYIMQLFPPSVEMALGNNFSLRNNSDYITLARRTVIYSKSVIPSAIQLWNNLPTNIRES